MIKSAQGKKRAFFKKARFNRAFHNTDLFYTYLVSLLVAHTNICYMYYEFVVIWGARTKMKESIVCENSITGAIDLLFLLISS